MIFDIGSMIINVDYIKYITSIIKDKLLPWSLFSFFFLFSFFVLRNFSSLTYVTTSLIASSYLNMHNSYQSLFWCSQSAHLCTWVIYLDTRFSFKSWSSYLWSASLNEIITVTPCKFTFKTLINESFVLSVNVLNCIMYFYYISRVVGWDTNALSKNK